MKGVACRSCGETGLQNVLSLGAMPLANALLSSEDLERPELRYPLDLVFCPACGLAQIAETVPPEDLFGHYLYFSSFSDTFLRHAEGLADRLTRERSLHPGSLVVEVASNDGYLLQFYARKGVPVLGIEPAENVAQVAREERGVPTISEFFGAQLGRRLRDEGSRADVVHAHNVLAHVADLNGFVRGLAALLKDEGVVVIEIPHVKEMVDRCEFDTIYHEHLCYFSLTALVPLFARHDLRVAAVERVPVHGGSLRLFVDSGGLRSAERSVESLLAEEKAAGVDGLAFYSSFAQRVEGVCASLRKLLRDLSREGRRIAAYGAAAKGTILLNALGLEPGVVDFVADRSPHKQGRFVPGVRLPIRPPEALVEDRPDYVLLLAWNLADEILAQQAAYREAGGRFIVPLPEVSIL